MAKVYYVTELEFLCLQDHITVGDAKTYRRMPYDGEFLGNVLGPRVTGCIQDAGTGTGQTTIQLRNSTRSKDYFTTRPGFKIADVDANNRALLSSDGVFAEDLKFKANDIIELDIDAIPSNSNSAICSIYAAVGLWREVS